MNCGAFLTDMDLDYCPNCGYNVLIQKKVDYLSKIFYNQGLEKASIRDLSGAIACLKQSLMYDKRNIRARNLLGLVYFETGEVVSALSEWVISKNLQPTRNLASEYINKLQANPNKLAAINETIKKYNHALMLCREGHEDMAAIQLRKILTQNSKLIKGYHLLALIQMKNGEWNKARRILKKAARIDKTNTTTLRFLREVDEQTGVTTRLEKKKKGLFRSGTKENLDTDILGSERVAQPTVYREHSKVSVFFILMDGIAAGAVAFWLLAVPAIRQGIYQEANQQIVQYSESLASQGAELTKAQGEAKESGDTVESVTQELTTEQAKSESYQALLQAYTYYQQQNLDEAAVEIQKVHVDVLTDSMKSVYTTIRDATGVAGIGDTGGVQRQENSSDSTEDTSSSEDTSYDESDYSNYDEEYYE
ncbi:tetratricopeptide repeat protein [Blautia obeum ATCC 29174]|uniref:Tetratricopeptide repeat protein n=2 Tax=Blautia obeum TaxID=40520 RepID=A5ZW57_9FIRM|nr:tetratricopeptide repeat protein [Blautia obeum ATCC 29174]